MVTAICINDKNMPKDFPSSKWVKEHNLYHITHVWYHPNQGYLSVSVREINLDGMKPYNAFRIERFAIPQSDITKLIDLMRACGEMNEINIEEQINKLFDHQRELEPEDL